MLLGPILPALALVQLARLRIKMNPIHTTITVIKLDAHLIPNIVEVADLAPLPARVREGDMVARVEGDADFGFGFGVVGLAGFRYAVGRVVVGVVVGEVVPVALVDDTVAERLRRGAVA